MYNKKNKDNSHMIYGINNAINFLLSKKSFKSINIFINNHGLAAKNKRLVKLIENSGFYNSYINNKEYNSKFQLKHDQGIVIQFKGEITKVLFESIDDFKDDSCLIIAN